MKNSIWLEKHNKDLTGKTFGHWTVINYECTKDSHSYWQCQCKCGTVKLVNGPRLRQGRSTSCGCLRAERCRALSFKHGEATHGAETVEWKTWIGMLGRCVNPQHVNYKYYGARGIKVCERWKEWYEHFLSDMGRRPSRTHSIDRIDNDGDYCPENCRWATRREQNANRRNNKFLTALGKTQIMIEWERETGLGEATIRARLRRGWTPDKAVSEPLEKQDHSRRIR